MRIFLLRGVRSQKVYGRVRLGLESLIRVGIGLGRGVRSQKVYEGLTLTLSLTLPLTLILPLPLT